MAPCVESAVVVGGGIAGTVAAMALQQAGIDVAIYERHRRDEADIGAFLTFAVNGMDALASIGAADAVLGHGFSTPLLSFTSGTGRHLGTVPLGGELRDGTSTLTIKRADLCSALRAEAARRGIDVVHGAQLIGAETFSGRVRARFADGTHADGDVIVGADGIHSSLRAVIDPAAPVPRYVPVLNVGGYAHPAGLEPDSGTFHMTFGKRAFFGYSIAPDGTAWWFANPPRRREPQPGELGAISDSQWRAELHELFDGDATPAAAIIDATPDGLVGWATYDLPKVPRWHRDAMIVIGDAAHATSPSSGQGASLAIEDAVILAQCLRDASTVDAAFGAYESKRRTRVEKIVAAGARSSNSKAAGPIGRRLRDAFMPMYLEKLSSGDPKAAFMFDHHIEWSSPVR